MALPEARRLEQRPLALVEAQVLGVPPRTMALGALPERAPGCFFRRSCVARSPPLVGTAAVVEDLGASVRRRGRPVVVTIGGVGQDWPSRHERRLTEWAAHAVRAQNGAWVAAMRACRSSPWLRDAPRVGHLHGQAAQMRACQGTAVVLRRRSARVAIWRAH